MNTIWFRSCKSVMLVLIVLGAASTRSALAGTECENLAKQIKEWDAEVAKLRAQREPIHQVVQKLQDFIKLMKQTKAANEKIAEGTTSQSLKDSIAQMNAELDKEIAKVRNQMNPYLDEKLAQFLIAIGGAQDRRRQLGCDRPKTPAPGVRQMAEADPIQLDGEEGDVDPIELETLLRSLETLQSDVGQFTGEIEWLRHQQPSAEVLARLETLLVLKECGERTLAVLDRDLETVLKLAPGLEAANEARNALEGLNQQLADLHGRQKVYQAMAPTPALEQVRLGIAGEISQVELQLPAARAHLHEALTGAPHD